MPLLRGTQALKLVWAAGETSGSGGLKSGSRTQRGQGPQPLQPVALSLASALVCTEQQPRAFYWGLWGWGGAK